MKKLPLATNTFLILIVFALLSCVEKKETEKAAQELLPNIIWLVAEDQSPNWFPMYGDSTMRLPYIESLAKDGVLFTNAYSPVPVCAPARSAIITGMYPTTLGTHNMRTHAPWRGVPGKKPYKTLDIPSYSPVVPDGVKMFTQYLREKGYYTSNGPKEDYNFKKLASAWDDSGKEHHWSNRKEGQPFFSVFNFSVCHESQIWARGKEQLFLSPSKVQVPPYFPDNEIIRHDLAVNYSNLKRLDNQIGQIINGLKADGLYDNSIIFFYGDHGGPFPRHKRAVYETGTKVPMVIKFPNYDKAGSTDDRFISFIDLAPTVLSLAGIEPPKVMQGVAHFGKFEVANKPKYSFHSADRFDAIYDRLRAVRSERYKYIKSFDTTKSHGLPVSYREQMPMMRELRRLYKAGKLTKEQALWLHPTKPEEELYDLQNDPYELHNLANLAEMQDTLIHYRKVLNDWIQETNDLGRIPEEELLAKWLPNGKQEQLPPLEMEDKNDEIRLLSKVTDATILWRQPNDSLWNIYMEPLPKGTLFEAKAERIGYADSEVLESN
ncbi:MAG: sulfatase [Maribacter sp.]|uniref:sulfatase family protein n=1 Tax=Maribacter sp. TaxID=1897614 RepID=UPI0032994CBF